MRRIKRVSVTRYIISYLIGLILALSLLMVLFVNVLADRVIYYDIQSTLIRELIKNNRSVYYEDGMVKPDEDFRYIDDGVYYQVLAEDGSLMLGESPKGTEFADAKVSQRLRTIEADEGEYYILDRSNKSITKAAG